MSEDFEKRWGFAPDSDYEVRNTNKPQDDFFPLGAVQVLAALKGKTIEECTQSLLEQEKKLKEEYERSRKGTK